jgi:hypothetical protein
MYGEGVERGAIKDKRRYKQLISYEGMERRRHITPTDIDGLIDYAGNAFILLECKLEGKDIEAGQKRAIENVVNAFEESGRKACCLLFRHNSAPEELIIAKDCIVSDVYYEHKWHYYNTQTVMFYVKEFEQHWTKKGIYL